MNRILSRGMTAIIFALHLICPLIGETADIMLYYPPGWKHGDARAAAFATALSRRSGLKIEPRITESYARILSEFSSAEPGMVYAGSFVQTLLYARGLSVPLGYVDNGRQYYTSIMIAPADSGSDPLAILGDAGSRVAYCVGSSSGESGARAATSGAACLRTKNHTESADDVRSGLAGAAFVKNWWWEDNKERYPGFKCFEVPGVTDFRHVDNVLSANKSIGLAAMGKIKAAAAESVKVLGGTRFGEFCPTSMQPSLKLMLKAGIDPMGYSW